MSALDSWHSAALCRESSRALASASSFACCSRLRSTSSEAEESGAFPILTGYLNCVEYLSRDFTYGEIWRGFLAANHYKNVMPSFGALLVSLIAVPVCFYMIAERREERNVGQRQGKPTEPKQDSRTAKH